MLNFRKPSTDRAGRSFDPAIINAVWSKAQVVFGSDPNVMRKDSCGAWIRRDQYGQTTDTGWEIDHDTPVARGGSDDLSNLKPLQWSNNRHKGDSWPSWQCAVRAAA
jgi:hypothetical protein